MKKFTIKQNKYLGQDIQGYYNQDYVGYQQKGNPDCINHLKNISKSHSEIDLVRDFIEVAEKFSEDIKQIIKEDFSNYIIIVVPRSKKESSYSQSQLMFKKAISSVADNLGFNNCCDAIKRIRDTKTTHNWRLDNNTGNDPYVGITKDTCEFKENEIKGKNIILVDDIYTEGVYVAEDCIQSLLDLGAKSVTLYVIAKTRS